MTPMTQPAPIALDGTEDDLITLTELANWLHVAHSTVWTWVNVRDPALPVIQRAGRPYTTKEAYRRWLAAQNGRTT